MAAKPSMLSRAADKILPAKVVRLIALDGSELEFARFEIPASKDWPGAVIFGIGVAEKVFVRDAKSGEYRQVSYCNAPMPPQPSPPFSGRIRREPPR